MTSELIIGKVGAQKCPTTADDQERRAGLNQTDTERMILSKRQSGYASLLGIPRTPLTRHDFRDIYRALRPERVDPRDWDDVLDLFIRALVDRGVERLGHKPVNHLYSTPRPEDTTVGPNLGVDS